MLHFAAFLCVICAACAVFKRRFEQILPMALLAAMLVLTALAMAGKLLWAGGLAIAALAAIALLLCYVLLTRRITFPNLCRRFASTVLTPGFACFGLLAAFFLYAAEPMVVWFSDDVSYWALEAKSLWIFNGLADHTRHLNLFFSTYVPGVQVLQWWVMHAFGEWRESTLHFALFMTYAAFLLPLFSGLRWKHAWAIPLACLGIVVFPILGNSLSYSFLSVDTILGLCFGYTMIQAWTYEKGDALGLCSVILGLCGLVLIKQIGLLFAALAVVLLILRQGKKGLWAILPPVGVWGIWMLYCRLMGLTGYHTSGIADRVAEMLAGTYVLPNGIEGVWESLWHSLTNPFTTALYAEDILFHTAPLAHVPKVLQLLALILTPWLFSLTTGQKALRRVSLCFGAMTAGYLLFQYFSFFTVFYYEVDVYVYELKINMLMLMERYLAPLLLGMGMFALFLLAEAFPRKLAASRKWLPHAAAGVLAAVLVFMVNWGLLYEGLLPRQYIQKDRALGAEGLTLMDHDWGYALEGYNGAYVLVGLEPNSDFIKNLRYTFAPAKFALPEQGFTESAEALSSHLAEEGITHVILFDESSDLYAPASELAEDGVLYTWALYQVTDGEDGVALVEYY